MRPLEAMKRAAAVCVSSMICVVSAAPFVACDTSSSNAPAGGGGTDASFNVPETSAPPPNDAAVDGLTPVDGGEDAAPNDSATVVVTKDGAPDPGVTVVFQSGAGDVLATVVSGADGKAASTVAAGAQITVALGAVNNRQLITYVGVKPGDVLEVVEKTSRALAVTIAPNNPGGGISIAAGNFDCSTNAATSGSPVGINLLPECITGPVFPVVGNLRFNLQSYFSFKKDVTPAASGTTTVSGMSSWAVGTAYTLNVTNAPDLTGVQAALGHIANNQSFAVAPETNLALVAGAGAAQFVVATGYADAYQADIQFVNFPGGYHRVQSFSKRFAAAAASPQTVDLTAGVLPALLTVVADTTSPARPMLGWTASAALTAADSGVVTASYTQPIAGGGTEEVEWTFIVPPDAMNVTAPALPASLAAFAPSAASTMHTPTVAFFESDLIPSYDFVRAHAAELGLTRVPIGIFSTATIPALPAAGTLRITALATGG